MFTVNTVNESIPKLHFRSGLAMLATEKCFVQSFIATMGYENPMGKLLRFEDCEMRL